MEQKSVVLVNEQLQVRYNINNWFFFNRNSLKTFDLNRWWKPKDSSAETKVLKEFDIMII
jgi:hypothetical protein